MSKNVPYFKIESFGAVDGPGVRLVIFTQGCPYRCVYCHNPESWNISKDQNKISVNEIIKLYEKNKEFYKNGGITISGGEPMIHLDFIHKLAKELYKRKISLCIDTSGATFIDKNIKTYKKICKYNPLWLVDIKHIDQTKHKQITGVSMQNELDLIKFLEQEECSYWIRQVILPGYTDAQEDLLKLRDFVSTLKFIKKLELLPYHKMATSKYEGLNIDYKIKDVKEPSKEEIEAIKQTLQLA